jgi:hypothetical protein
MRRFSLIADDNVVCVDGLAHRVDVSDIDQDVHAVQWHSTWGEIEFKGHRKPNQRFTDFSPFQKFVARWAAVDSALKVEAAAKRAVGKPATSTGKPNVIG